MIPVRVPADATVHTVGGVRRLDPSHPLFFADCPACDGQLGELPITLVFVGTGDRRDAGWTTGGAVAVHADCAGVAT